MSNKLPNKIVFNHFYRLRHDIKRSFILSPGFTTGLDRDFVIPDWISRIHPIYAMMFSLLSEPIELSKAIEELAYFFSISEAEAEKMIIPFIHTEEPFYTSYGGTNNGFPKNLVIDASKAFADPILYTPDQFSYEELDFKRERLYVAPASLGFMVNNTCATDCLYCYADKTKKAETLSWDNVEKIVLEAANLNLVNFTLLGGEVFLYEKWRDLLDILKKCNFNVDFISTKLPLKEKDIKDIKHYNLRIQISLDSLNSEKLMKLLHVGENYVEQIKNTIKLLEQYGVNFQVATVLTNVNDSVENLVEIHDFLNDFKNISRWEIRVAFRSLYSREDFNDFKISKEKIDAIAQWGDEINKITNLNILWVPDETDRYFETSKGSSDFRGNRCSANYSNIMIMPDGKVTICEQLYWNKHFIIGDVKEQTLAEIWNSKRALELSFPKKEDFRDESVCKTCEIFDDCFSYPNKCFADILKGYGLDNWDYPDPRCEKAPPFMNSLFYN